jgi:hypothetical protein
VFRRGQPRGHFVLFQVQRLLRLAGVWHERSDLAARDAMYALAQQAAQGMEGVFELSAMGSGEESARAAETAGLRIRTREPVFQSTGRKRPECPALDVEFQLSDFDGVFSSDDREPFLC